MHLFHGHSWAWIHELLVVWYLELLIRLQWIQEYLSFHIHSLRAHIVISYERFLQNKCKQWYMVWHWFKHVSVERYLFSDIYFLPSKHLVKREWVKDEHQKYRYSILHLGDLLHRPFKTQTTIIPEATQIARISHWRSSRISYLSPKQTLRKTSHRLR